MRKVKYILAAAIVTIGSLVTISYYNNHTNKPVAGICHSINGLPDKTCTPGIIDMRVTQANIHQTICVRGYTATVRPPVSITNTEKIISEQQYGYKSGSQGEYDHLIPLELGGSSDTKNLWFESGSIPNAKDSIENQLRAEVCSGTITLQFAQQEISTNWKTAK